MLFSNTKIITDINDYAIESTILVAIFHNLIKWDDAILNVSYSYEKLVHFGLKKSVVKINHSI